MKKSYLSVTAAFIFLAGLLCVNYSCQKDLFHNPGGNSGLHVYLTDDPSLVLDAVYIDIQKLEVKLDDDFSLSPRHGSDDSGNDDHGGDDANDDHNHGGWIALDLNAGVYNLMNLRNGIDTSLAQGDLPAGSVIKRFRITLGSHNSVVYNGSTYVLQVKDNDNQVEIKFEDGQIFTSGNSVSIWLDFDAGRSIRMRDNTFELRSSIRAFSKERSGRIEGRVLPASAFPVVYAINGTDTSTARPDREGEFKLVGLKAGIYQLFIDATANNYRDTVIQNVRVESDEDVHTGVITLTQ